MDASTSTSNIHVRFTTSTLKSIDQFFGERKRNAFIRASTEKELKKLRMLRTLEKTFGAWSTEDHPELSRGSIAYQRKLRKEGEKSFRKKIHS